MSSIAIADSEGLSAESRLDYSAATSATATAIPASAIPASAIPASAIPASAIPLDGVAPSEKLTLYREGNQSGGWLDASKIRVDWIEQAISQRNCALFQAALAEQRSAVRKKILAHLHDRSHEVGTTYDCCEDECIVDAFEAAIQGYGSSIEALIEDAIRRLLP